RAAGRGGAGCRRVAERREDLAPLHRCNHSITSSARAESGGGLRDQLRRKPWQRRSTSRTSITSVAGAILVNAPTLGGWYLLQGQAVAISRTTGIYALPFSGLSRRKGERGEIGVTRIECSRTQ